MLSQRHRRGFSLTFPSAAADYGNFTLLHGAAKGGRLDLVEYCLELGARDEPDDQGQGSRLR